MRAAGARSIRVFPSSYYNGWQGTPAELQNRLLSVIDFSESPYYGDVAANAVYLALHDPTTPRSSDHFLANLRPDRLKSICGDDPRLGRFLVYDFMHYIAERRRPGVDTLFIIDEFNALRMREETSVLFEQVRSFGGCIIIAAQGYAGLGPNEFADLITAALQLIVGLWLLLGSRGLVNVFARLRR